MDPSKIELDQDNLEREILSFFNKYNIDFAILAKLKKKIACEEIIRHFVEFYCIDDNLPLKVIVENMEKAVIMTALSRTNGNQVQAAKSLGIKYTTLNEKVKRYNINFQKKPAI